jgi:hypothetical protein
MKKEYAEEAANRIVAAENCCRIMFKNMKANPKGHGLK